MKKTNLIKRKGRKSSVEKIYLSGEKLIEIIEVSRGLGDYPLSSLFTSNISIEFIYRISNNYGWKLELLTINKQNQRLRYTLKTTTYNKIMNKYYLVLELEEEFVLKLIEELNG